MGCLLLINHSSSTADWNNSIKTLKSKILTLLCLACTPMIMLSCSKSDSDISDIKVTEVSLDKTSLELLEGDSETLTATVLPEDATDARIVWTSDKPDIADVDQTGKVTAVKMGTAVITVIAEDGSKSAGCVVTVTDGDVSALVEPSFAQVLKQKGYIADAARIMKSELLEITELDIQGAYDKLGPITSLKGIEFMTNLTYLDARYNRISGAVDFGENKGYTYIRLGDNSDLTSVDVRNMLSLKNLKINDTKIASLDLSGSTNIDNLEISGWKSDSFDFDLPNLAVLVAYRSGFTSFDASKYPKLTTLSLSNNKSLTSVKLNYPELVSLPVESCKLKTLDISGSPKLRDFHCSFNPGEGGKFVVTVWKGFTRTSAMTAAGHTWTCDDGSTAMLEYREKQ